MIDELAAEVPPSAAQNVGRSHSPTTEAEAAAAAAAVAAAPAAMTAETAVAAQQRYPIQH